MRDLSSAMSTALDARVVRPVLIGRLDIQTDPVAAWNGPGVFAPSGTGDTELDGYTFDGIEGFIDLSSIKEDQGIGGPVTITAAAHDLDEVLLKQVVRDKRAWRGQAAFLWLGLLDDDTNVISNPTRIKTGVMTAMEIRRGPDTAAIIVTIDQDFGNASGAPFRILDHPRIWSSDTFSTFMTALSNKPQGLTRSDTLRPGQTDFTGDRRPGGSRFRGGGVIR